MQWTKPDFQDIPLGMEVSAYVNTDDSQPLEVVSARSEESASPPTVTCGTAT
jgi:coenzyme PQQ precursor peptide PqqA